MSEQISYQIIHDHLQGQLQSLYECLLFFTKIKKHMKEEYVYGSNQSCILVIILSLYVMYTLYINYIFYL